jgi:FAD/FMN-containing dehydrogenase
LLCGSEGTLGVVTAARLRLVPRPVHTVVALLAFDDIDAALDAVGLLRREVDAIQALELFLRSGLDLVCTRFQLPRPFPSEHEAYVLVEAAAHTDPTDALASAVAGVGAADVAVATDNAAARAIWRYREAHTEAINLEGAPLKLDVSLPADRMSEFMQRVAARVHAVAPDAAVYQFGHAGDGNVHVNVTGYAQNDEPVTAAVLEYVAELNGSISAEHGIGAAKRPYLSLVRSPAEIATYRAIKHALDPLATLNPNVLLPEEG